VTDATSVATVLGLVLGIGFGALALGKILALPPLRERAHELGFSTSAFRIVGALELAGATGLLTGLLWPPIGYAAAAGLLMLLVGAVISQRRAAGSGRVRARLGVRRRHRRLPADADRHLTALRTAARKD